MCASLPFADVGRYPANMEAVFTVLNNLGTASSNHYDEEADSQHSCRDKGPPDCEVKGFTLRVGFQEQAFLGMHSVKGPVPESEASQARVCLMGVPAVRDAELHDWVTRACCDFIIITLQLH